MSLLIYPLDVIPLKQWLYCLFLEEQVAIVYNLGLNEELIHEVSCILHSSLAKFLFLLLGIELSGVFSALHN